MRFLQTDDKKDNISGGLVISEEVIAAIALNASMDVDGVAGFATRAPDVHSILKTGDSPLKSVRVWANDNDVKLQIYLIIKDSKKIPTVAAEVQRNVKNAVQSMTGKVVSKVNISIAGIDFSETAEKKA